MQEINHRAAQSPAVEPCSRPESYSRAMLVVSILRLLPEAVLQMDFDISLFMKNNVLGFLFDLVRLLIEDSNTSVGPAEV